MIQDLKYYKPSLGQSWWLVLLLLVGSIVGGGISLFWPAAPQALTYFVMMMLPLLWCVWQGRLAAVSGVHPLALNAPHFGKLPVWAFFVLAAVALIALSIVIEPTTSFIPMPDSIKAVFEKAFVDSKLWDMIASTCILAPLLEELLCRGLMMRGMLTRMKPGRAIFWSALIFAVMHLNPWQSIPAFLIGLFLGWVYWRTHCLWATIFLHCLNNSLSTLISRVWPDLPIDAGLKDILAPSTYWIVYAAAVVVLVLILYLLHEKTVSPQIQSRVEA
ncbi:MAG: CPBP family intramembrane metalloprotease [Bacteroidales bacterium]|jgi:membrane protease YdiL (CAAX protease family)|nr:CPBP family intramembrane metalloprotease [Bacteroidales bacterium]